MDCLSVMLCPDKIIFPRAAAATVISVTESKGDGSVPAVPDPGPAYSSPWEASIERHTEAEMACNLLDGLELSSLTGSLHKYVIAVVKPRCNECQGQDQDSSHEDVAGPANEPEVAEIPEEKSSSSGESQERY
ncbi:hypothetical protein WISP_33068 [Willisornis vidua]|uniref:Uncharacterized protein n=1 Tax=Willisornis vidua TaxID=1566151 RepID=A0ABQ9DP31_9PASS|nr:hypothetical protein WISP_33068 [Willisornis vidua]